MGRMAERSLVDIMTDFTQLFHTDVSLNITDCFFPVIA
jgi:hypothetical protein